MPAALTVGPVSERTRLWSLFAACRRRGWSEPQGCPVATFIQINITIFLALFTNRCSARTSSWGLVLQVVVVVAVQLPQVRPLINNGLLTFGLRFGHFAGLRQSNIGTDTLRFRSRHGSNLGHNSKAITSHKHLPDRCRTWVVLMNVKESENVDKTHTGILGKYKTTSRQTYARFDDYPTTPSKAVCLIQKHMFL